MKSGRCYLIILFLFAIGLQRSANGQAEQSQAELITFDVPGATDPFVFAMNDEGTITGWCSVGEGVEGFIRAADGTITTFVPPGGGLPNINPTSINRSGTIVGKFGVASLSITPQLIAEPAMGRPGDSITIQGVGFESDEPVKISWDGSEIVLGTATTDSTGTFSGPAAVTFAIPASALAGVNTVFGLGRASLVIGKVYVNVETGNAR